MVVQEVLKRLCIKLLVLERNMGNKRKCNMKAHVNADQYRLSSRDQHIGHKCINNHLCSISAFGLLTECQTGQIETHTNGKGVHQNISEQ